MRKLLFVLILPALALAVYDMKWFDLNNWRCPFYNDGRFGIDTAGAGRAGGFWLDTAYVFGGGIWFGAIVNGETLVTEGYNPNSGGTECVPTLCRYWRDGYGNAEDRIYSHPGDWPPPLSRFPMAPQRYVSDEDYWSCFCDSDPAQHVAPGLPIGVDISLSVLGFTGPLADDIVFLRYDCYNSSDDTISEAYAGLLLDPDVGPNSGNDLTGLILDRWFPYGADSLEVRDVGFAYSQDHVPSGMVAVKLLSAPAGFGLTTFKRFSIDYDPVTDPTQYMTMAGFDYRTGEYLPYDSIDQSPGDRRFLLSTGPFDLQKDSSVTFCYAVIGSPFWQQKIPGYDTTQLARRCHAAESLFGVLTGIEETRDATGPLLAQTQPTIVRGVLSLPKASNRKPQAASLLDISGRMVLDLKPGANDVSRLAPGVYFVRETQAQAVRKIVVANW
jgi:hypothetical protein